MNKNFKFYMSGIAGNIIRASWDTKTGKPSLTPEEVANTALEYATALANTTDEALARTTEGVDVTEAVPAEATA